ncbi:uncharacterized protein [Dermacentor andersoni]|uniref:uncharacterized protein n=1 Tax=Dermacentor andersoni TaxID=34620 RepID=UPI003B3A2F7E
MSYTEVVTTSHPPPASQTLIKKPLLQAQPGGFCPAWTPSQIDALCHDSLQEHELRSAMAKYKRHTTPGADGITFQMLRNLDKGVRCQLLGALNDLWQTGSLPETWLTVVVVPIRKPGQPTTAITSYRPLSLTSAACKLMETIALGRLNWIAGAVGCPPEQQTGFRRHRCTAGSIADVISTLEEVRVGRTLSTPRRVVTGVPLRSILSPFLLNAALAGLSAAIPGDPMFPTQCSLYADDVALWTHGPRQNLEAIRSSLQRSLDAVGAYIRSIGLLASPIKTKALLIHLLAAARVTIERLVLGGTPIEWAKEITYLGLQVDLACIPATKAATIKARRVRTAVSRLFLRGKRCTSRWSLSIYHAAATSMFLYALPMRNLTPTHKKELAQEHRTTIQMFLGLPRHLSVAATLAEAQAWPLPLLMPRQGLLHIDRLHHTGDALVRRLRSHPSSQMGSICALYDELAAVSKLHVVGGRLHIFTDGSVLPPDGSAAAACTVQAAGMTLQCRLPFAAHSTAAELAGFHLAADFLAEHPIQVPVAIISDSRPALQGLLEPDRAGVALLLAKLSAIPSSGIPLSLHWLPSHVRIARNKEADAAAKAPHYAPVAVTTAVAASDYTRHRLLKLLTTAHPDARVASGEPPQPLPEKGFTRREEVLHLRLRTGSVWPATRKLSVGRNASPACRRCGSPENLEDILCHCPGLASQRQETIAAYSRFGLPANAVEDLLFHRLSPVAALQAFLEFAAAAGLAIV